MEKSKKLFKEMENHLMNDEKPSIYFNYLLKNEKLFKQYPFNLISDLEKIPQSPVHHPEGSVWNHTMLVVDNAAKRKEDSKNPKVFMWAALLHDIGKGKTTKVRKGKITSYEHDTVGKELTIEFLEHFIDDKIFIKDVSNMVRWHMQTLFVVKDLPFADIKKMVSEVSIDEIALLSLCDRLGRGQMTDEKMNEERENIKAFLLKCQETLV
ncbi:HDIG domain-containing protein [Alkalithermobacter thermoalcaliphilus JW-YL-7 = DSM 7308]|uniref:HDIG domain-containing protein n=1 Tax=Alkalithermobacter thermoalcaliphilus JW-YL-7 = DSM 7308 TaxID=1121328 RepID=A0A150FQ38_CLOPD|nr:metal dependent phosphohydrolase [[Clostridium] paradoxum JW-YL-7 = DSM 7308]SHK63094.1 HDIG domain-containing protein [[Clostridium] paradoxum JW-YL-7 = DSM 7308]